MKHDGKLEKFPSKGPLFIKKKEPIEHRFHNNHKNLSRPKDFNKNTDTPSSDPNMAIISYHQPRVNWFRFEEPYGQINNIYNTNDETQIIDAHEEHIKEDAEEE